MVVGLSTEKLSSLSTRGVDAAMIVPGVTSTARQPDANDLIGVDGV
jgi:hypothetical protein